MNELGILGTIAGIQVVGSLVQLYLTSRVREAARGAVEKGLSDYRHQLERKLEDLRLDRERTAHEFGLFAAKRNEVYTEAYSRCAVAVNEVNGAIHGLPGADYVSFDRGHLIHHLRADLSLPQEEVDRLVAWWGINRDAASAEMAQVRNRIRRQRVDDAVLAVGQVLALNELYYSDEVRRSLKGLSDDLLAHAIESAFADGKRRPTLHEVLQITSALSQKLAGLKEAMRDELRRGFDPLGATGALP